MNAIDRFQYRQFVLGELCGGACTPEAAACPNRAILAGFIAGRVAGLGCLPAELGLDTHKDKSDFARLNSLYFPHSHLTLADGGAEHIPELDDLFRLLMDHRAFKRDSEAWVARIVATACAGRDHLWQDLGLADRGELSHLMRVNFPALTTANSGDMKWKKFLYKQLCERDGTYVCPAPSCGECVDRPKCFGPET